VRWNVVAGNWKSFPVGLWIEANAERVTVTSIAMLKRITARVPCLKDLKTHLGLADLIRRTPVSIPW
jgi:hypothetical protein